MRRIHHINSHPKRKISRNTTSRNAISPNTSLNVICEQSLEHKSLEHNLWNTISGTQSLEQNLSNAIFPETNSTDNSPIEMQKAEYNDVFTTFTRK